MKSFKTRKYLTAFLVFIICLSMVFTIVACNPQIKDSDVDVSGEDTANILNGNFERATGTTYPLTPESWSGSAGQTGGSSATPTDEDSLANGIISVNNKEYDSNKRRWGNLTNPGLHEGAEGDRILMINNKVDNAYRYTLSNVTLAKSKYYLVTLWIKTVDVEGFGASLYLTNSVYFEIKNINTNGEWVKYSFYIETSDINAYTMNISVGLGESGLTDGKLAKGYLFVDDIYMGESNAGAYNSATVNSTTQKYSLTLPDNDFNYTSSSSSQPYSLSSSYTAISGDGVSTGSSYVSRGIVDTSIKNASIFTKTISIDGTNNVTIPALDPLDDKQSSKMLLIAATNSTTKTTVGYRSSRQMRFNFGSGKYYKLSIRVASYICEGDGGYIKLTQGSDDKSSKYQIKDISTNGEWTTCSFYIKSNEVRNRDFFIEFWLGDGGSNETGKLSRGYVFYDYITLDSINEEEFNLRPSSELVCTVDLTDGTENIIKTNFSNGDNKDNFAIASYIDDNDNEVVRDNIASYEFLSVNSWNETKYPDIANPLTPTDSASYICLINHKEPTISRLNYTENNDKYPFEIIPNKIYRLALWVKTEKAASGTGLNINLIREVDGEQTTIQSISNFNSSEKGDANSYNGYTEIVFYIEGSALVNIDGSDPGTGKPADTVKIGLEILFGSGSKYSSSLFAKGYAFITNANMQEIDYTEYSNVSTSDTVLKHSLYDGKSSVTNGNFNTVDKTDAYFDGNGNAIKSKDDTSMIPAKPLNWTESAKNDKFTAGIINYNNSTLLTDFNLGAKSDIYNGYPYAAGAPNFMYIGANENITEGISAYGYSLSTGNKLSLSANTYYKVTVWLKLYYGKASIVVKNSTDNKQTIYKIEQTDPGESNVEFKAYDLYIEVGMSSASLTISVYLGDIESKNNTYTENDRLIFDSVQYITIDSDKFNSTEATSSVKSVSYVVDGFDTSSDYGDTTSTVSPTGWTGALVDSSASSSSSDLKSGILSKEHSYTTNWLESTDLEKIFGSFNHEITDGERKTTETLDTGNYVLVIDALNATTYKYTTSSSTSFSSGKKQYEVSVWVMTQNIEEGKGAFVKLLINKKTYSFDNINTNGVWKKYTFMIQTSKNNSLSSIYVALGIGKEGKDNYVKGRAFFDDVTIREITNVKVGDSTLFDYTVPAEYTLNTKEEEENVVAKYDSNYKMRLVFTDEQSIGTEKEEEPEPEKKNDYFWLIISSAVVGGIIVLVIFIYYGRKLYIKKIKPRMKNKKKKLQNYKTTEEEDKQLESFKDKE